jgi:hypothetical protein
MANLASGISCEDKPKAGGMTDEGAGTEGSKEEERGEHDRLKAFTACGREPKEFREALSVRCPQVRQRMSRKGNCAGLRLCGAFFQDVKSGSG